MSVAPRPISLLITGDEEGTAVNGTLKVMNWMTANGEVPDHCPVGEFGFSAATSRKVDEAAPVVQIGGLAAIYRRLFKLYCAELPCPA